MREYKNQLEKTTDFLNSMKWEDELFYSNYLAQTYYFVCHSTRLLARSISHFGVERDFLYKRFIEHLKEENYHERIALNDLNNLGKEISHFPQLSITKTFWERQYFLIDESKGISILGYIFYLEAVATNCSEEAFNRIKKNYGSQKSNFIKIHANEDPAHVEHALKLINSLSENEQKQIWDNFFETADLYHHIIKESYEVSRNNNYLKSA